MASKRVQDIAKNLKELPKQYVQKESNRPIKTSPPPSPIPVVDLHLLSSSQEDEMKEEMERLRTALQTWGFFQAIGHGISSSLLDEVGQLTRDFFNLPMEEKQRYSKIGIGGHEDGMEAYGNDIVSSEDQILNWNDRLYLLVTPEEERKLDRWPENPSTFREILHEYSAKMKEVGDFLLKAMAKLLDLEENYFVNRFGEKATMYVRFNYYPPCSKPDLVLGVSPHSDGGGITILLQDNEVDGLEVLRNGEWVNVPAIPHALLVNLGDQVEIMSNGDFKSPVHRAVTNSEKERVSVAMFFSPDPKTEISPADELVDTTKPRLYKKVKVEEYIQVFMKNYALGKRTIDWAKV
ncbi:protein LATERAL BRANCHING OXIDOREDUCTASE 1-like [Tasmannia lanceolata]|uniref:protein LATERAL BRANCHING OXIDOREDUCTASE 1-like n=1 Tax=Tasmannia lanceolata TaxID=3420 RepID=UPI004063475E